MAMTSSCHDVASPSDIQPADKCRKSTIISDDSVLGSPDEISAENSEHDEATAAGGASFSPRHLSVGVAPTRFHSFESDSDFRGIAMAFFAQRPKSFDADTEELLNEYLFASPHNYGDSMSEEQAKERNIVQAESKDDGNHQTLERMNAVDDWTPVNTWRSKQGTTDRDGGGDHLEDQIQRSPLAGSSSPPAGPATGFEVTEIRPRSSGRRSADAASGLQLTKGSSFEEARLHRKLLRNDLSEVNRQQTQTSLAQLMYKKSQVMYASQQGLDQQSRSLSKTSLTVSKTSLTAAVVSPEPQNRSASSASIPRRSVASSTEDLRLYSSPKSRISPQVEKRAPGRPGGLTVTVSPLNPERETKQPAWKSAAGGSPFTDRRRPFQLRHYMTVVDTSSSNSDRSVSPQPNSRHSGARRRVVRRRSSNRHKYRYSNQKADGGNETSKVSRGVSLTRSKSDASDVIAIAKISQTRTGRSVPRANKSVNLLVAGRPHDRQLLLASSDARSASSDSTFTGIEKKGERRRVCTMKDRQWHRDIVKQYQEPQIQSANATNRYPARPHDNTRRSTTVVILPPTHQPYDNATHVTSRASTNPELHKPSGSTRVPHGTPYQSGKQEVRPRDSSCPRHGVTGGTGRRRGNSESKDLSRVPYPLASTQTDGRTGRRPSATVAVECPNPRLVAHKPRPAIDARRPSQPMVSDLPKINWSVRKLRDHYGGGDPSISSANLTSTVTTVKVDDADSKPLLSHIGAVQRLL